MALQTDLHLPRGGQASRVHDGASYHRLRPAQPRCVRMILTRTVAALAIDAIGKAVGPPGGVLPTIGAGRDLRVTVMAKHAAVGDLAAESGMLGKVVGRAHSPMPTVFGIPRQRQLDQIAGHSAADVAASVAAGT